jgi:formate dehydrogenase subunit delta
MNNDHMVHMANQIAQFFSGYKHDEAVAGVLGHIKSFWEKRMRAQLQTYAAAGGAGLSPLVLEAAKKL